LNIKAPVLSPILFSFESTQGVLDHKHRINSSTAVLKDYYSVSQAEKANIQSFIKINYVKTVAT